MELNPKQHKIGTNFRTVQEEDKKNGNVNHVECVKI